MLNSSKRIKHQRFLASLPMLQQDAADIIILSSADDYRKYLLSMISQAKQRIYIVALYLENDEAGQEILHAIYQAKLANRQLDIAIFVDWHRAQRGRIGEQESLTNADWYHQVAQQYPQIDIPVYGVPVNTREVLGVLHLKGAIIDDSIVYTGASINNVYLSKLGKYRQDRYHVVKNKTVADSFINYINMSFLNNEAVNRLNISPNVRSRTRSLKHAIKQLRSQLKQSSYLIDAKQSVDDKISTHQVGVYPIVGLGKGNDLNSIILHLMGCTKKKLVICTPYFNLPSIIAKMIIRLLRQGVCVEIIVGDKTANDFYIPEDQPFKMIGMLPYMYEMNLRRFCSKLQGFIDHGLLNIRVWKDGDNTYHVKGVWIDDEWMLITGNNLNPRAWRLDLENAILIRDPSHQLLDDKARELDGIRLHTTLIEHYQQLQSSHFYPTKVRKVLTRLRRVRLDRIVGRLL